MLSIDVSYFPPFGVWSTEIEIKHKRQFFLAGGNYDVGTTENAFGYKVGYGFYPYKNEKRLNTFHQVYYYKEFRKNKTDEALSEDIRVHYFIFGTGLEYWFQDRTFSLGGSAHAGYGHETGPNEGTNFFAAGYLTAKFVLVKD